MFGYVIANMEDLSKEEQARYRACYCGLCHKIKERYGSLARMALTYDMTFLILLLNSLYEPKEETGEGRCIAHPLKKHQTLTTELTAYAADMNVYLAYYNSLDDAMDEGSLKGKLGVRIFRKNIHTIETRYPRQTEAVRRELDFMRKTEGEECPSPDAMANSFGRLMAELFVWKNDQWEDTLRRFAASLGSYIYFADAYEDFEKDVKNHSFNPFAEALAREPHPEKQPDENVTFSDYEKPAKEILTMYVAEASNQMEKLPLVQDIAIIRNILYSGVWTRILLADERRKKKNNTPSTSEANP